MGLAIACLLIAAVVTAVLWRVLTIPGVLEEKQEQQSKKDGPNE